MKSKEYIELEQRISAIEKVLNEHLSSNYPHWEYQDRGKTNRYSNCTMPGTEVNCSMIK